MVFRTPRPPKYRRHPNGQAFVQHQGRRRYLGRHASPESVEAYNRFVAELLSSPATGGIRSTRPGDGPIAIAHLGLAYLHHAEHWYQKDGKPTTKLPQVKGYIKILRTLYESLPVEEFGPLKLQAIQAHLVAKGLSRVGVNERCRGITRIFKWGVAQELVPPSVYQALACVPGLRKGRTPAPETDPVGPVDNATVEATLPELSEVVADMVQFQRLTGARPGEVCILRPCDVDRSADVWVYVPGTHKTEHHGRRRTIYIGPRAQTFLARYLLRDERVFCFSPAESEKQHRERRHAQRKTPLACGNRPGMTKKPRPERRPGICFTRDSYRRAIHKAVAAANRKRIKAAKDAGEEPELLPLWSPNRLRHSAATEIRREFGLEAAQVTLGHAKADVTQVYAERDETLAREVARKIG